MPDSVAIIAPSSGPDMKYLKQSIDWIESRGYRVVLGPHIEARSGYCAGSAKQRAHDLRWALEEAEGNTVWLARGGYGLVHCLPDLLSLPSTDKTIIGSSDATLLLELLCQRGSGRLVHGPMVERLAYYSDEQSQNAVMAWVNGKAGEIFWRLKPGNSLAHTCQPCRAPLTGGNLTVIASLCGTVLQHKAQGCFFLLEDVNEPLYRIDRCLQQLIFSGVFNGVKAIILGEFHACTASGQREKDIIPKIIDILAPLKIPLFYDGPFGHGKHNIAWPYRQNATLSGSCMTL